MAGYEHGLPSWRSELADALLWIVLGATIFIGSWTMDRLKEQGVNPYTAPGLVPGLLGLAIIFFGVLMLIRAARGRMRAAGSGTESPATAAPGETLRPPGRPGAEDDGIAPGGHYGRLIVVLILCLGFAVGLVGRGLPFWLAAAVYIAVTIIALQYRELRQRGQLWRGCLKAVVIGLSAGVIVTLVFQNFFLVRLP